MKPINNPNITGMPQTPKGVCSSELVSLVEQAINYLSQGGTGCQYDPSWIRPRTMSRDEINDACIQAYYVMHKVKEILEANDPAQRPPI